GAILSFMRKSLLFIGNYGNRNIGDDAILFVLSRRYKRKYPDYQQYVLARAYSDDIYKISLAIPLKINISSLFKILLSVDMIIIGGGGIFSSYTGPIAKFIPLFALFNRLIGKTVIYESIGVYPTASLFQRITLYISMIIANKVSVRDRSSYECLAFVRKFRNVLLVKDPAFLLKPVSKRRILDILKEEKIDLLPDNLVGFSIKGLKDINQDRKLKKVIIETISFLSEKKIGVLIIPFCHDMFQTSEKDNLLAECIINSLPHKKYVYFLKNYYHPREIMGVMNLCKIFVGMRFHSLVFAHILRIPLIPIPYEKKCEDFIEEYNYKNNSINLETATSFCFKNKIFSILKNLGHCYE
ncbi:MAG: polysaccharide pyruvyl transferase family protein, partial [Candidatus Anstonellales archaeon]